MKFREMNYINMKLRSRETHFKERIPQSMKTYGDTVVRTYTLEVYLLLVTHLKDDRH
jgi:hypothetical protein